MAYATTKLLNKGLLIEAGKKNLLACLKLINHKVNQTPLCILL